MSAGHFDMAPESERRECPTCGLTWYVRHGHACPKPWPYERARSFCQMAEAAAAKGDPIVVHPRTKAAIRMGLQEGEA